jgi:hypothetical protein
MQNQKQMRYPASRQVAWALNLTQLLSMAPDGGDLALHRDGGYLELNVDATTCSRPLEYLLSTVWAMHDFAPDAVRFVPGSHRWPQHRRPLEAEAVRRWLRRRTRMAQHAWAPTSTTPLASSPRRRCRCSRPRQWSHGTSRSPCSGWWATRPMARLSATTWTSSTRSIALH